MSKRRPVRTARPFMPVKKGDMVLGLTGESAGRTGKVLQVLPKQQRIIVEGFNYVKKHMRKTQDNPQGGIVEKEAPIHVSNVRKAGDEGAKA